MKKFKAMIIACLCAVTTFVTLGAVKSTTTARADDSTYQYVDTTVTGLIRAGTSEDRFGFVVAGNDYETQYNGATSKDYTNINGLNTLSKIKFDGNALAETVWNGNTNDPYLNLWTIEHSFVICENEFKTATEITVEAGCEFPSYALWSGSGNTVYRTTETVTFTKVGNVWIKSVDAEISMIVRSDENRLGFVPVGNDYAGHPNYNGATAKDYTNINGLNTLTKIKVNGEAIAETAWNGATNDPYLNLWTAEPSFVICEEVFRTATEITIEAGCEFASYGLWSGTGSVAYRTTEDVTFRKVDGAWYKVYTATFVDEAGNELGKATFTTADADLTYPTYEADPAYDYVWTNNEIKAENITVTLTKTIKTFDVIIGDAAAVKYNYGTKITAPENPTKTKDGYTVTFDGWYNGETKWNFETDTVTSNVTLVAKFNETINTYSAKLVLCDGTEKDISYTIENRAEKLAEAKTFLGANDAQYTYTNDLPTELPLENGRTYTETRTLNEYDVKIGESATVKVAYGNKLTKPESDPTKDMTADKVYTFDGWYNGETKWNFETDTVTSNVTLVAKFNETARKYTVTITFVGLEKDEVTLQVEYNGRVDFSAYAEDGYNMTIKNGETEINGLTVTGDANITVTYAKKPAAAKKGCGGSVNGVMPVLAILCLAGAVVVTKKKRV